MSKRKQFMAAASEKRNFINERLTQLQKQGHNMEDLIIIHSGIGDTKESDLVAEIPKKVKIKSVDKAGETAHIHLSGSKCQKDEKGQLISGHAVKINHKGEYAAIIINKEKAFNKTGLPQNVMFLPKHWTTHKEVETP